MTGYTVRPNPSIGYAHAFGSPWPGSPYGHAGVLGSPTFTTEPGLEDASTPSSSAPPSPVWLPALCGFALIAAAALAIIQHLGRS